MSERKDMWSFDVRKDYPSVKLRAGMQLFFNGSSLKLSDMTVIPDPIRGPGVRVAWPLRGEHDDFKTRAVKFLHRQQDFAEFCETIAALCGLSIEKLELPPDAPSWRAWEHECSCLFGELKTENGTPKTDNTANEVK